MFLVLCLFNLFAHSTINSYATLNYLPKMADAIDILSQN